MNQIIVVHRQLTKLTSDKLFIAGNSYSGDKDARFAVVRYGNVMGSRGSVIPFFISLIEQGILPITDERMTRFMITLEQGVELVWIDFGGVEPEQRRDQLGRLLPCCEFEFYRFV